MGDYKGDLRDGTTLRFSFTTVSSEGVPTTLAGTPALDVYKAASTTPSTLGITLAVDHAATGHHRVTIDTSTSTTFYETAADFDVIIQAGTVGGNSVVGYTVGEFSIENRKVTVAAIDDIDAPATWKASINTEADNAIVTYGLDHLVSATVSSDDVTSDSIMGKLVSSTGDWGTFDPATDSLEAIRNRGDSAWATATGFSTGSLAEINAQMDTALADINLDHLLGATVSSDDVVTDSVIGKLVSSTGDWGTFDPATDSLEALRNRGDAAWIAATGFSTHTAAEVWSAATRTLTDSTNIVLAKGVGLTGLNDLSSDTVNAAADTAIETYNLDHLMGATVSSDDVVTDSVIGKLASSTGDWGTFDPATDSLEALRNRGDAAWITATGFSTGTLAEIKTQVQDVLSSTTISDLSTGAPPATPTYAEAIMYPYSALVHRLDSLSTAKKFYNNAGTEIWTKVLTDDSTTYSEAEGS